MTDSSDDSPSPDFGWVLDWIEGYYHVVVVAALMLFMFWNRARTWGNFIVDGEVLFSSNDPWYHYRQVSYTVENWPSTMPFDPWTFFPNGNASGQFGTLFDQIIATLAMIVGLGNPDEMTVALVTLFAPALFGTAVAIPTYFIGRRLGGRLGGVVAVVVLALASGGFLQRSLVGFTDHHIAEALFMSVAVLGVMVAVSVASRDKPIYEQVRDREIGPLRSSLGWAALAGIAITLYLWVWPFGALLLGILGIYFVVQLSAEFLRGESPEHTALVGAAALSVTGLTVLSSLDVVGFTAGEFSLLQPVFAFAIAGGCVFMAWLARTWERRDLPTVGYPAAVFGAILATVVAVMVALPDVFNLIADNVYRVLIFWVDPSETGRTVGEVQPLWPDVGALFQSFGFAVLIAVGAAVWILGRLVLGRRVAAEKTLIVVWAIFLAMATLTQQRFEYYLVVPVAALTGYAVGGVFEWLDLSFDTEDVEFYQVVSVIAVVLVVAVPLVLGQASVLAVASANGAGGDIQGWTESLDWMQENTPEEGLYDDNSTDLEFYGTYERTEDFEYEDGAYGVMSWWDYGHWITQQGHRIPHANPHQQGAETAANFLLSSSEEEANDVLSGIDESEQAQNRYVMVDWKMANSHTASQFAFLNQRWGQRPNGKFFAPTQFTTTENVSLGDYALPISYQHPQLGVGTFNVHTQEYYNSTVVRLYRFHGSAAEPSPVVVDWERSADRGRITTPGDNASGRVLNASMNMSEARAYVAEDESSQIGGIGDNPPDRVPAMEHYRLVGTSNRSASSSLGYRLTQLSTAAGTELESLVRPGNCGSDLSLQVQRQVSVCVGQRQASYLQQTSPQWTKVFERVDGAEIEGTGPANTTVQAAVEMYNPASNETFVYRQQARTDENGEFTMTVPYSTTGYDQWGPENGRTNVTVRATGNYQFVAPPLGTDADRRWTANASVPEAAVIGETDQPITVELTEDVPEGAPDSGGNSTTDGDAAENLTSGGDADENSTSDGGTDGNSTSDGNTSESLAADAFQPRVGVATGGFRATP